MTPEGKVKDDIKKYLISLGDDCWFFMPMMMGYGRKGIPDIVGCLRGNFFAVEVKAPGKEKATTPWQDRELHKVNQAGGYAIVISSAEELKLRFEANF